MNGEKQMEQLIMVRKNLAEIPDTPLPAGYHIRFYAEGDDGKLAAVFQQCFDLGWSADPGTASDGFWVREDPNGKFDGSNRPTNPEDDTSEPGAGNATVRIAPQEPTATDPPVPVAFTG